MKNIFAYTGDGSFPPYISLNETPAGNLQLTVRGEDGNQVSVAMPDSQLQLLGQRIAAREEGTRRRIEQQEWDMATKIVVPFTAQVNLMLLRTKRRELLLTHKARPGDVMIASIPPELEPDLHEMPGFVHRMKYGTRTPQPGEIGSCDAWRIFVDTALEFTGGAGLNLESTTPLVCATRPNDGTACEACQ